jgi:hypothetical protein
MVAQDHGLAQRLLGEAVAIAQREPEPSLEALVRWLLGISLTLSYRLDDSEGMARSALELFQAQGDEAGEGCSTSLLGFVAVLRDDFTAGGDLPTRALSILASAGDVFGAGHCHWYLALLARAVGDPPEARHRGDAGGRYVRARPRQGRGSVAGRRPAVSRRGRHAGAAKDHTAWDARPERAHQA